MLPGGADREANVALSRTAAEEMPRQLGPRRRAPCARIAARSALCRSSPSEPTSAKPAEMTQTARMPASSAEFHRLQNCGRRDTDNREIDGVGYIGDRAVSANAGHRITVSVHRVGGSDELARENVAEEFAADGAPARRRPDDGDRARSKNGPSDATTAVWSRASTCEA